LCAKTAANLRCGQRVQRIARQGDAAVRDHQRAGAQPRQVAKRRRGGRCEVSGCPDTRLQVVDDLFVEEFSLGRRNNGHMRRVIGHKAG